jgi:hypothetical protein
MSRSTLLAACIAALLCACQKPPAKPLKPIVQAMPALGVIAPIIGTTATVRSAGKRAKAESVSTVGGRAPRLTRTQP